MSPQALRILTDSAITSGAPPALLEPAIVPDYVGKGIDARQEVRHFAAARGFSSPYSPGSVVVEFKESTRPLGLNLNVVVETSGCFTSMSVFKENVTFVFQVPDRMEFRQVSFSELVVAQGPSRESWTIPTWNVLARESALEEGLMRLSASVEKIRQGVLPRRPAGLLAVAQEAARRMAERRDEDLEQWSRRLGREMSDAND